MKKEAKKGQAQAMKPAGKAARAKPKKPGKPAKAKAVATGAKEREKLAETVRKANPLAAALLGFLESVGARPDFVIIENDRAEGKPGRKKPTARKAEGPKTKKVRRLSDLIEGLGFDKAGTKRLEKDVREKVARMKAVR